MRGAWVTQNGLGEGIKLSAVRRGQSGCLEVTGWLSVLVGLIMALAPRPVDAAYASAAVARELVYQLQNRSLTAFAVVDPTDASRYIAVRNMYGGMLSLISARPLRAAVVAAKLHGGAYDEVYLELIRSRLPQRFFVRDADADGLLHALAGSGSVDIVWTNGSTIRFNSNPESQGLTDALYQSAFESLDRRYAEALTILTVALKERSSELTTSAIVTAHK